MSDLIYREDAKDFVRYARAKDLDPIEYLDEVPAADVVEVVRCKDCKYWNPYKSHHYKGHFCDVVTLFVQEDEYCAWGKRKGGADDGTD